LALHPGGELIAAADGSGKIRLRKINAAGEFIKDHFQPWQAHQGHIYCLAWSADGSHLHSAGVDGRLIRWSLEAAMHQSGPDRICLEGADSFTLIPETTSLVTSGRSLVKWNWVTGQAEASFQDAKGFHDVTISPDGKLIAAIDDSRAAKVFVADEIFRAPPNAARCLFDWNPGGWVGSIHFSPDSKSLAVRFQPAGTDGQPDARRVWLHGPPNYQTAEQVPVPGAKAVAFASNGQRLALLRDAGLVLWNISPRTLHWEKAQSDSSVVVFSPNGKLLASGGGNRVVIVRTADDGIVRHQLVGHRDNINALAFSPDNATLAAASLDGVIKLWHVPTGQEMFELRGTGGVCHRVEFTGDGRNFLALVDADPGLDEILVYRAGESEADE
jgi:WD40 repeat protein